MIYLDNSATTPVSDAAVGAMAKSMTEGFFNPSALYAPALTTERAMDACRDAILRAVHAPESARVTFTSGGTEADNLAILGRSAFARGGRVLYTAGEHPAVREACLAMKNVETAEIPYQRDGRVDLAKLEALLTPDTRLICVMQVNNETGAVMQLAEIAALRNRLCPTAHLHVDGVQGFLRVPFDMGRLNVQSYALSGHKIHAPKGIGALVFDKNTRLNALQVGGGQEKALRSGTENVPGIMGLMAAIENYPVNADIRAVKIALYEAVKAAVPEMNVNGPDPYAPDSAPHILNLSLPPVRSETMLHALEGDEIYVGVGSACSSQKQKVSRVLRAMNAPQKSMESALRFSLSPRNTKEEMLETARCVKKHYDALKAYARR